MPPWFADPGVGHFANERRLVDREIATLNAWADGGAPAGNEADAPPALTFKSGWNIKPDIIVEMPKPFELPARGTINYKYILVKTNFTDGHVGHRRRDAARRSGSAASRQGVGAAARIEVDGERGPR